MAVLAIFYGDGFTSQMYDTLRAEVGWAITHPEGAMIHVASFDESGSAHVADVWESPEALDAFVQTRLGPTLQKLNFPVPEVKVYLLHNLDVFPIIHEHMLA
ncbi:MAG: hypothetical protein U0528_08685 [Anaerolineae bacterium]